MVTPWSNANRARTRTSCPPRNTPARRRAWEFLSGFTLSDRSQGCMPKYSIICLTASAKKRAETVFDQWPQLQYTLVKNVVSLAQAEISYCFGDFRLKILLYYSLILKNLSWDFLRFSSFLLCCILHICITCTVHRTVTALNICRFWIYPKYFLKISQISVSIFYKIYSYNKREHRKRISFKNGIGGQFSNQRVISHYSILLLLNQT